MNDKVKFLSHLLAAVSVGAILTSQSPKYTVTWNGTVISQNGILVDGNAYVPAAEIAKATQMDVAIKPESQVIAFQTSNLTQASATQTPNTNASQKAPFGEELVINGGFESGSAANSYYSDPTNAPGWQLTSTARVGSYAEGAFAIAEANRPANSGKNYYVGGWGDSEPKPIARQTISLADFAESLKSTPLKFQLKALMGAPSDKDLRCQIHITFLDKDQKTLAASVLSGPSIDAITEQVPLQPKSTSGDVPKGATAVVIQIKLSDHINDWYGCYVDNVSLSINP